MVAYYVKRSRGEEFEKINKPIAKGLWVDAPTVSNEELKSLAEQYNLEQNIIIDVKDKQELPRIEFSQESVYIFLRAPTMSRSGRVVTTPTLVVLQQGRFITISTGATVMPQSVMCSEMIHATSYPVELLQGVIAAYISQYEELLLTTERTINDTGRRLHTHEVTNQDFIHFVTVEDNLTEYKVNLDGILAVVRRLKDIDHKFIDKNSKETLDDIALHIQQLLVAVVSYDSRVQSIRDAYSTIANNTLNQRMKTLTVFTVLMTLPNVFYGMFGMNVTLPFMHETWAYAAIVGLTVFLIIIVYFVAKRLRIF